MSQYKSIVFIADPAMHNSQGLTRAAKLAQLSGASLRICMFTYENAIGTLGRISLDAMQILKQTHLLAREKWLHQMKNALTGYVTKVETELHWGTPIHEKLVSRILELEPDLVVKDVSAEPGLKRLLYTPLDWQLLRLCPAPLLLVNPNAHTKPRRIIAAVDPTEALRETNHLHDNVVQEALNLAIQCEASVYMVHAFESPTPLGPDGILTSSVISAMDDIRAKHRSDLLEYAKHFSVPRERMHLLDGLVSDVLPRFADDCGADVIAVGTIHHTGLERVIMGSTAERILGAVHCDVLAVKPEGFLEYLRKYLGIQNPKEPSIPANDNGHPSLMH